MGIFKHFHLIFLFTSNIVCNFAEQLLNNRQNMKKITMLMMLLVLMLQSICAKTVSEIIQDC